MITSSIIGNKTKSFYYEISATFLLSTVAVTFVISCIVFALNGVISGWIFPVSVLISSTAILLPRFNIHDTIKGLITGIMVIAGGCVVSSFLFDNSYDGNAYHQEAITFLLDGWNPFYSQAPTETFWVNHYAKALEIVSATIASATGNIESGKAVNIIIFFSMLFFALSSVEILCKKHSKNLHILIAACICANPVVTSQIFSFYNDYALYCFIVIDLSLFIILLNSKFWTLTLLRMGMATILAADTKFSHFFYMGILWIAMLAYLLHHRRNDKKLYFRFCATGISSALIAFFLTGFHPYMTNTIDFGNPLFPLVGGNVDIMSINTPDIYSGGNRFSNFLISLFSQKIAYDSLLPNPAGFLTLALDSRVQGFGPFMGSILFLSIAYMLLRKANGTAWYAIAVIFLMTFCFEQSWWARYTPFLWLIPCIALISTVSRVRNNNITAKTILGLFFVIMLTTGGAALGLSIAKNISTYLYRKELFTILHKEKQVRIADERFATFIWKMNRQGIEPIPVERDSLDLSRSLYIYGNKPGMPVVELNREDYEKITQASLKSKIMMISNRKITE